MFMNSLFLLPTTVLLWNVPKNLDGAVKIPILVALHHCTFWVFKKLQEVLKRGPVPTYNYYYWNVYDEINFHVVKRDLSTT